MPVIGRLERLPTRERGEQRACAKTDNEPESTL